MLTRARSAALRAAAAAAVDDEGEASPMAAKHARVYFGRRSAREAEPDATDAPWPCPSLARAALRQLSDELYDEQREMPDATYLRLCNALRRSHAEVAGADDASVP